MKIAKLPFFSIQLEFLAKERPFFSTLAEKTGKKRVQIQLYFFITLRLYHGHFINCQKAKGWST